MSPKRASRNRSAQAARENSAGGAPGPRSAQPRRGAGRNSPVKPTANPSSSPQANRKTGIDKKRGTTANGPGRPGAPYRSPGAPSRSPGAPSRSPGAASRSPGTASRSPGAPSRNTGVAGGNTAGKRYGKSVPPGGPQKLKGKDISPSGRPSRGAAAHQTKARIRAKTPVPSTDSNSMRLQKFLASAGVGSRRDCEVLIVEGRIEVDNKVITELGTRIDPTINEVSFDGERVRLERLQYFMLNKPTGVLSTSQDPAGRARVVDLISSHQRVYNVGRLDKTSEGLILVTNDGPLAQYLTHPSFGIEKVYQVTVAGSPHTDDLNVLKQGVHLMEGIAKVKDVQVKRRNKQTTELQMTLDEGKNREIRRMLAKIGHKVLRLVRVAIGPLQMGNLTAGAHRRLTPEEIAELKDWAERAAKGQSLKSVIKPKADRADKTTRKSRGSHDETPINPVEKKIAEGRPLHVDDIQKSQELRAAQREAAQRKPKRK